MQRESSYGQLIKDGGFEALLWTQFLATLNLSLIAGFAVAGNGNLAGAALIIPFLLFAGYAGQLADRFSKTRVLQVTALLEIGILLMAARSELLVPALFLLATLTNFFSPPKYGILPEMLGEGQLTRANGLLGFTAFPAIVIGYSFGASNTPLRVRLMLLTVAIAGSLVSLGIRKVLAARSSERFHGNPLPVMRLDKSLALSVCGISWFWFIAALFFLYVREAGTGLMAALAAGIASGGLAAGALSGSYIELALVPAGFALTGISAIAFGLSTSHTHAVASLFAIGCGGGFFAVPLHAYLQQQASPAARGRILATNNFANILGVMMAWLVVSLVSATFILILGMLMFAGSIYLARRIPETVVRFVLWCILMSLFRVRLEGRENIPRTGGALMVSNHISYADAVLVGATTRRRTVHFVMWKPIFDIPVANYFFRILQGIPIDATSPKSTVRALRAAREELRRGELVGLFPEGSISRSGKVERFERGFEKILQGTGVPVIPIHIEGLYGHPLSCKGGSPFLSWENLWRPRVTVRIGAPIHRSPDGAELRQAVVNLVR